MAMGIYLSLVNTLFVNNAIKVIILKIQIHLINSVLFVVLFVKAKSLPLNKFKNDTFYFLYFLILYN